MNYEQIKNMLSLVQNPTEKLEIVMDIGKTLEKVPSDSKCSEIFGCTSFVQICEKDGCFYGVADSMMVRGIVAIILSMVNGKTKDEIKKIDMESEFKSLNLQFGAARLNGIKSMISFFQNL